MPITLQPGEERPLSVQLTPIVPADIVIEHVRIVESTVWVGGTARVYLSCYNYAEQTKTRTITGYANGVAFDSVTVTLEPTAHTARYLRFTPSAAGIYTIQVDGHSPGEITVHPEPSMPPPPESRPGGAIWYGIVLDYNTGGPIEGVKIEFFGDPPTTLYTDGNGWFSIFLPRTDDPWQHAAQLDLSKEGYYPTDKSGTIISGEVRELTIGMWPVPEDAGVIKGKLCCMGEPIPSIMGVELEHPTYTITTKCDASGYFVLLDIPPGNWTVIIMGRYYLEISVTVEPYQIVELGVIELCA